MLFALGGCMQTTLGTSLNCASLIGPSLREPTQPADLPADNTVGELAAFGDRQTGAFEKAETKRSAIIETADQCESERVRLMKRPWWRF